MSFFVSALFHKRSMVKWQVVPIFHYFSGTNFTGGKSLLWIPIDRGAGLPLKRQVYGYIRLQGRLKAGEKLPATRELASQLGISRNVIIEAYEQLLAEGYIEARQGAGTFVSSGACLEPEHIEKSTEPFVVSTENQKEKKRLIFVPEFLL